MSKFIILKHTTKKNRNVHLDLRFEKPNSKKWVSFVCEKPIPLTKKERIMVIKVNDHSREHATFTGKLKSGYGAGDFKKVDEGDCDIEKYNRRHIVINFKGEILKGTYHFVSVNYHKDDRPRYMLFKI